MRTPNRLFSVLHVFLRFKILCKLICQIHENEHLHCKSCEVSRKRFMKNSKMCTLIALTLREYNSDQQYGGRLLNIKYFLAIIKIYIESTNFAYYAKAQIFIFRCSKHIYLDHADVCIKGPQNVEALPGYRQIHP